MKYIVRLQPPLEKHGGNGYWTAQVFLEPDTDGEDWTPIPGGELMAGRASVFFRNMQSAIETDLDKGSLEDRRVDRDKMAGREPGPDTPNDELDLPDGFRTDEEMLPEEEPLG